MKNRVKQVVLLICLLTCTFSLHARKRVIDQPDYEIRKTGIYEVVRIELDDTETRLHIQSTFIPGWWVMFSKEDYIVNTEGGEKLYATAILNGEFDKQISMPASGDSTFIVIYPSLDKSVKKIDVGDESGTHTWGVSLEKPVKKKKQHPDIPAEIEEWLEKETQASARLEERPLSWPFFTPDGKIKLVGYIKGYDPRVEIEAGMVYASNNITHEDFPVVIAVNQDGRFEAEIPATHPAMYYIYFNKASIGFYGEPDMTTGIVLDWEDFLLADRLRNIRYQPKKSVYYGPLKQINQELSSIKLPERNYNNLYEKMQSNSYEEFKQETLLVWDDTKEKALKEAAERGFLQETIEVLKRMIDIDYGSFILELPLRKEMQEENEATSPLPESYYDFLTRFSFNDHLLMVSNDFKYFMNRFEFIAPLYKSVYEELAQRTKPAKSFEAFLEEDKQIAFSEENKEYLNLSHSFNLYTEEISEAEKEHLATELREMEKQIEEKYKNYREEYEEIYLSPLENFSNDQTYMEQWKLRDQKMQNNLGLTPGFISDISKIGELRRVFENMSQKEASKVVDYLSDNIQEDFLLYEAQQVYNSHFLNEDRVYVLPEGAAADLFRQIIAPYKGKYLLVDFWGIYCGPCIHGIKEMKEERNRLKGDPDLDFLFITSVAESPKNKYEAFVEEQELEHSFLLSGDEYKYLRQLFRFSGIPRYILVDPDGRILNNNYSSYSFIRDVKSFTGREDL